MTEGNQDPERRPGTSPLHGRPLDDDGKIAFATGRVPPPPSTTVDAAAGATDAAVARVNSSAIVALRDNLRTLRDAVLGNETRPAADTIAARLTYAIGQLSSWLPGGSAAEPTELRNDGPTFDEYVAAGYDGANYPPPGYTDRRVVDLTVGEGIMPPAGAPLPTQVPPTE